MVGIAGATLQINPGCLLCVRMVEIGNPACGIGAFTCRPKVGKKPGAERMSVNDRLWGGAWGELPEIGRKCLPAKDLRRA